EKGVRQVLAGGAIAGYPLQDVRVTVYDGKYHSVDSKEVAFVAAGRKAFLDAVLKAGPQVLEPIVELEVSAPEQHMGDISGGLAGAHERHRFGRRRRDRGPGAGAAVGTRRLCRGAQVGDRRARQILP